MFTCDVTQNGRVIVLLNNVLGLAWDPEQDTVQFYLSKVVEWAEALEPTKRNLLSLFASVFDPLGLISPTMVSINVLFQS